MLALFNLTLCALAYGIAYREDRMTRGQIGPSSIPYIYHGGVWADWTIVTAVCYLASPYLGCWSGEQVRNCMIASAVLSTIMHVTYCYVCPINGHLVDPRYRIRLARLTWGGWLHALYFVYVLSVILLFYLYTPGAPRLWASVLLTAFVPLAVWQPGWYAAKIIHRQGRIDTAGWIQAVIILAILWLGGYCRFFGLLKS
jgi:hypothetical protein